jgi:hypothetical protein
MPANSHAACTPRRRRVWSARCTVHDSLAGYELASNLCSVCNRTARHRLHTWPHDSCSLAHAAAALRPRDCGQLRLRRGSGGCHLTAAVLLACLAFQCCRAGLAPHARTAIVSARDSGQGAAAAGGIEVASTHLPPATMAPPGADEKASEVRTAGSHGHRQAEATVHSLQLLAEHSDIRRLAGN